MQPAGQRKMTHDPSWNAGAARRHSTPGRLNPTRRVVLLGASNLTRSFATVVETLRQTWSEPLDILAAFGHGRSYGGQSTVFFRQLPGILQSGLWETLARRSPLPTNALVTDVGNDILYGVPPDVLLRWVDECVDRLGAAQATIILTGLPLASIERLGPIRYLLFRTLLFSRARLSLARAKHLVRELNAGLIEIGRRRKCPVFSVPEAWYGVDPIHVRRSVQRTAWSQIFAPWRAAPIKQLPRRPSVWLRGYLSALAPSEWSVFGIRRHCDQPSGRLSDGTVVSLF